MFLDLFPILRHFRNPTITRPISRFMIAETDIDMLVVGYFFELAGSVVSDEGERKLVILESCVSNVKMLFYLRERGCRCTHDETGSLLANAYGHRKRGS